MTAMTILISVLAMLIPAGQTPQAPPLLGPGRAVNQQYRTIKRYISASVSKMPVADFDFKPTDDVRSYGAILGHIVQVGYSNCSALLGEKNPDAGTAERSDRAAVAASIAEMFAYCDKAIESVTDANAVETVQYAVDIPGTGAQTLRFARIVPAMTLMAHFNEHYGNLVTYMRLKGVVPPSSEPRR